MPYHTASQPEEANADSLSQQMVDCLQRIIAPPDPPAAAVSRPRGRPAVLSPEHLCLAVLLALLRGLKSYACVWRLITWSGVGHFPLLPHTRDAIRKRLLHTSLDVWQRLLAAREHRLACPNPGGSPVRSASLGFPYLRS
ncbi:hypothetical protein KDH_73770 [Dictyobacter sp. S3.2.2.5]|uniref:H repeat-associated protein N-terminal domain-containing protein n=1 Tax=Dictyobacter halimunensis TaxID=3026934 RepID=A0ABQ6G413_9CHLR|nr:hypothetical protein KDH_20040 [Dictyobacter sp. S3.2.2.5]GLV60558.1 hypothetical protein KDH_73770 [Dictyobacter sp. S3.2.2.5]